MKKNNKKDNTLIKRNNLKEMLREEGIKRINEEAILEIESLVKLNITQIAKLLKEHIIIMGRATVKKEDVKKVMENIKNGEEEFEI